MVHSEMVDNENLAGFNPIQFGYEDCKPSHFYGPALREYWLLHYVVKGKGIFVKGGKTHVLSSGDIFVIAPYEETYYEADRDDPWHYIWIGFTADTLPCDLSAPVLHCPEARKVFEDAKNCKYLSRGKSAFLSAKLWELASLLLDAKRERADYVDEALDYINAEFMNKLTVQGISKKLNIDRSYFSNIFKNKVGMPPQKYLTELRLTKAAELMTVYGQTPMVAAYSVGYQDLFAFSKIFKNKYGISPREYVKRSKKQSEK